MPCCESRQAIGSYTPIHSMTWCNICQYLFDNKSNLNAKMPNYSTPGVYACACKRVIQTKFFLVVVAPAHKVYCNSYILIHATIYGCVCVCVCWVLPKGRYHLLKINFMFRTQTTTTSVEQKKTHTHIPCWLYWLCVYLFILLFVNKCDLKFKNDHDKVFGIAKHE